jgi:hypothetical protein
MNLLIKPFLILIVICLAIFVFVQTSGLGGDLVDELISHEEDIDDDDDESTNVIVVDGYKALRLDEEVIEISGVVSESVERMFYTPETIAYAEVVDVAPLVALKTEYEAALAQQNILINDLSNHNKILKRAEALHKAKSLSARELDKIRADRNIKSSQLSAINTQLASIQYKVKSLWGDELASYLLEEDRRHDFDLLASHKKKLILLSMPKSKMLNHEQQKVFISHVNEREVAIAAFYLDQAYHVNNPLYGESYLYLLETQKIRTGMKLFAWIDENTDDIEGLFIPESAVIWYANEPWIYLKHDEELFIRKPLGNARKINRGWLLEDEYLVGDDLVVTRGGQTLLSEEFKWAIPDEEDD